jgi:hypothetical protein
MAVKQVFIAVAAVLLLLVPIASATPLLQLYIEGASYDKITETWVYDPAGSSGAGGATIRIWAIGNVDGGGGKGTIYDVKLSVAYASDENPGLAFVSSTTGGYGGYSDPSTPSAPAYLQTVTDGSSPIMGDGGRLPTHDIYGSGTTWQEYSLGNFSLTDSPTGDFIKSFPTPSAQANGQINVYELTISNVVHGDSLHFDLYDHYFSEIAGHATFAPFSHDADGQVNVVPEPASLLLLGAGLISLGIIARRKKQ